MKILHKNEQTTTKWSGGLTTELYIFPEDSDYKERDFKYRLSTATVEIEESTFTPLHGIERTLMVLEGEMELIHHDHHSVILGPLMKDEFLGEWTTRSNGKCTDFNLMCRDGAKGYVTGYSLEEGEELAIALEGVRNFIYLYKGVVEVKESMITDGDFLILDDDCEELTIKAMQPSVLVWVSITSL